ncbi:hypothetical protein [Pseudomonas jessenii]|jgi:hypothetical protein|uniref:hypothetical protein n=1 Tax=Pseudomonas jessenii TaxID=77298 RepID=UPI0030C3B2D9
MKAISIDNAINRWRWLDEILARELTLTDDMLNSLKDMRCFCSFSVSGYFAPIAYNTLKSAINSCKLPKTNSNSSDSNWITLLKKRKQVFSLLSSTLREQNASTKTRREYELEVKECLWYSHLCSLAYLDLYRSIRNYAKEQIALPEAAKYQLEQLISESSIKFSEIISPQGLVQNFGDLSLIEGGKREH